MATHLPRIQFNMDMFASPTSRQPHVASADDFLDRPPSPRTDTSMCDLSFALSTHSLKPAALPAPTARRQPAALLVNDLPLFDCLAPDSTYSASSADSTYSSTRSSSTVSLSSSSSAPVSVSLRRTCSNLDVRRQRQRALWNQCSADHLDDISQLVAAMVARGDQCNVCESQQALAADHDSGIEDEDGDDAWGCDPGRGRPLFVARHRTARDSSYRGPCRVSKQPQMRKKRPVTR